MSIFGNLLNKIFHKAETVPAPKPGVAPPVVPPVMPPGAPVAPTALAVVDVEAILNQLAATNPQKLNWRTSIVDLMKLVGMESSLAERKELATELGYTGDMKDTAAMNIWLHKAVLKKLAENGGKVPADLLD